MYLIGIDISKYKHDCFIATETGEVIHNLFSFDNTSNGFAYFLSILQSKQHIIKLECRSRCENIPAFYKSRYLKEAQL